MLGNEFTMVGGWKWFNKSDTFQLKTPTIYQGSRKKGSPLDKSRTLHENPSENELKTFYASETVSLAHIISRVAALFDLTGQSAPLAVLGNYIARLALVDSGGDKHKQVT